jgi:hypothetical protein
MKIPSEKLYPYLEGIVETPPGRWRSRPEIDSVLRRRLTKKEYRLLVAEVEGAPLPPLMEKLRLDGTRMRRLQENIRRKLNRETIRNELCETTE